jgi:hypothetical protein
MHTFGSGVQQREPAYQHIQRVVLLEAGNHGGDKGMTRNGSQYVSLVPDMLYLFESYH